MFKYKFVGGILLILLSVSCNTNQPGKNESSTNLSTIQRPMDSLVYESPDLMIRQIATHAFVHISYLNTETFGRVPCNGMVITSEKEAIVFDTPADNVSSNELIQYFTKTLGDSITAVVPTHFHDDCLGGLSVFDQVGIPSYANEATIKILKQNNTKNSIPQNAFDNFLTFHVGKEKVMVVYFGEGHTKDNVVAWFPEGKILFGGCLIKELGAGKGNLEDANVRAWPESVENIKLAFPDINIVIPGHGKIGDMALLDYTIQLFQVKN